MYQKKVNAMHKSIDKKYIYMRDDQACFFCGKKLKLGNVSMDHYYPRSSGGTYDVFNLVACCKNCNRLKKSRVPENWKVVSITLFIKGIKDFKIFSAIPKIQHKEITRWVKKVDSVFHDGDYVVFESPEKRFYVRENKIYKIVSVNCFDDEYTKI